MFCSSIYLKIYNRAGPSLRSLVSGYSEENEPQTYLPRRRAHTYTFSYRRKTCQLICLIPPSRCQTGKLGVEIVHRGDVEQSWCPRGEASRVFLSLRDSRSRTKSPASHSQVQAPSFRANHRGHARELSSTIKVDHRSKLREER